MTVYEEISAAAAAVTALATLALVAGVVVAGRVFSTDQIVRFGQEISRGQYYGRFWHVEMKLRYLMLVRRPGKGVWLAECEYEGPLPARGKPGTKREGVRAAAEDGKAWARILSDALGPGYSSDGSRADMADFRFIMTRIAYWVGVGRRRRWVQRRRVRRILRVLGPEFITVVYRHRVLATKMVLLDERDGDASGGEPVLVADFDYFPRAYGVRDEHYSKLSRMIAVEARKKEFGDTMSGTSKLLESLEDAIATAEWPEVPAT